MRAANADHDDSGAVTNGLSALGRGDLDQAERQFLAARAAEPADLLARIGLAQVLRQRGEHAEADLRLALAEAYADDEEAFALRHVVIAGIATGDLPGLIAALGPDRFPRPSADVLALRCLVRAMAGDIEASLIDWADALAGASPRQRHQLLRALRTARAGRLREALQRCERVVRSDPTCAAAVALRILLRLALPDPS